MKSKDLGTLSDSQVAEAVWVLELQQVRLLGELSLIERLLKRLIEGKPLTDAETIDLRYILSKW